MGAFLSWLAYPPGNLKDELMAEIERRERQNRLPVRGGFLTLEFIDELFTVGNIAQQLREHEEVRLLPKKERIQLAQFIKQNQQKLYAILLLMDESHHLSLNNARAFTDESLFDIPEPGLASLPCDLATLETLPLFRGFASAFYEKQFVFPPGLPTGRTISHPPHFIFPFANERERVGYGSFGEVYKVEIPSGFLPPQADEKVSKVFASPRQTPGH
ncbi:hypothetical protein PtrSN002B_010278 [Pyrenophora tritici-repentis]|uniref:Uncharacterized protein n=2 Tax=Pyrenophora tritici-repentis TaxID=45151 RepID=A0A2W1DR46_9PLEO|nr:uncharacterized protein PTRG_03462 [Pyrenophora tritici-repentis Pt-1C-BFP]KAA8620510.1 hypothetical protein PtrV1_07604 [Pyrenophora tritici-repentis]EDU46300.1 predicted protein [Pyrenophora tritici-repentis Pt-1C-BFP]KAF7448656.1 hypothetical protein A1F99_080200 [Pyrenophora tritici-repentis]KAF7572380.1 hypothetical protein PtrM4_098800 [Pyrenophora tritici-repentis]KAG9384440.1 hypothetical protein A1F94_003987 [Pyrenophora tritici-repentis]